MGDIRERFALPLLKGLAFVALVFGLQFAAGPIVGLAMGLGGVVHPPVWTFGLVHSGLLLAATLLALRIEGATLASLGLAPTRRRWLELLVGFTAGVAFFVLMAAARGVSIDAAWSFAGLRAVPAACAGLVTALLLMLPEELLFRGYAFRQMVSSIGRWPAVLLSAAVFGAYHTIGTEMWGMGLFFQAAMPALGGVVFAWAAIRSGGLALPIGLHLGGNWVQMSVASLQPAIATPPTALWTAPLSERQLQSLYAPDLVTHVPYIAAMLGIAALVHLMSRSSPQARAFE